METLLIRSDFLTKTLKDPVNLLLIALLAVLSYLILWPFFELILQTITWGDGDRRLSRAAIPGEHTWFHWLQVTASPLSAKILYEPLINTLKTGLISTVLALLAGGMLAWCVVRSDISW